MPEGLGGQDYIPGSPESYALQSPEEWDIATNYWKGLLAPKPAGGGGGGKGGGKRPGLDKVSPEKWWEAAKGEQAKQWDEQSKAISEQGYTSGIGDSSMLTWQLNKGLQDTQSGLYTTAMDKQMQADMFNIQMEMQRRQMAQAAGQAAAGRQMAAASALFGAGSAKNALSFDVAGQLAGLGGNQFNMENTLANQYNNPEIFNSMNQFGGWGSGQGKSATYNPSTADFLGQIGGMIPSIIDMFGKGGGTKMTDQQYSDYLFG
jgi:hypothetical protein